MLRTVNRSEHETSSSAGNWVRECLLKVRDTGRANLNEQRIDRN
jgi:hypothetical protein